jgi:hypothetical protein
MLTTDIMIRASGPTCWWCAVYVMILYDEFEGWSWFILYDTVGAKKSTYMGFEKWWLPPPPEVKKPRSLYKAASLAYLGDCIYEVRNVTFVCMIFTQRLICLSGSILLVWSYLIHTALCSETLLLSTFEHKWVQQACDGGCQVWITGLDLSLFLSL